MELKNITKAEIERRRKEDKGRVEALFNKWTEDYEQFIKDEIFDMSSFQFRDYVARYNMNPIEDKKANCRYFINWDFKKLLKKMGYEYEEQIINQKKFTKEYPVEYKEIEMVASEFIKRAFKDEFNITITIKDKEKYFKLTKKIKA